MAVLSVPALGPDSRGLVAAGAGGASGRVVKEQGAPGSIARGPCRHGRWCLDGVVDGKAP